MLTETFRNVLEEYHHKKWFPDAYPDPYGEFIDYISKGMISDLLESWKRNHIGSHLDVAYYLFRILPQIQYGEIFRDYRAALSRRLSSNNIRPEFVLFYLRTIAEEDSFRLWKEFREWNEECETVLLNWNSVNLEFEKSQAEFLNAFGQRLNLLFEPEFAAIEKQMRDTAELFSWRIQQAHVSNDLQLIRHFRFLHWSNLVDWSDLVSLSKSVSETCGIKKVPELRTSEEQAAQFLFPIAPPERVVLEHGLTSGPMDALRFLLELGKGFFYKGMNPELKIEEKICGDPSLPWFWGYVFASVLTEIAGVKHFIGLRAEGLELDLAFASESWERYEAALTLLRKDATRDLRNLQDYYASHRELAFGFGPPRFMHWYDLSRSGESFFKTVASLRAKDAIQIFRAKYGSQWFASTRWSSRVKEYFWEGFRLTLRDVMKDL